MNKATQRTKINQFLRGKKKIEVDAFGIYQWIECCHFHGWWENAIQLSSFLPPNSLNPEYHKRLDYLLKECREGFKENYVELKNPEGNKYFTIPKLFWNVCKELGIKLGKKSNIWLGLEINDSKLILIEGIEQKGCFFKFYDLRKEDLIGWLKKHDFSHLIEKIRPIKLTNRKPCWLKLTWEEATDLIPVIVDNKREICRVSKSSKAKRKKDWPKRYVQREKFWISLLEKANGQTQLHAKILSPGPYNWIATGAGKSGLGYSYVVRMYDTQVELYIDLWDYNTNKEIFDKLFKYKNQIEEVFGENLEWQRLDNNRACRIRKKIALGGLKNRRKWTVIQDAMIDAMIRLDKALKPYITNLKNLV